MVTSEKKEKRTLSGEVISDKMDKTIVVRVERTYTHPEFHKIMRSNKKYKVHDAQEEAKVGDIVEFYEGRPVSKTKFMYLARVVRSAASKQS
ncbi:MAG TPA: 30S ribosomal protein S17 [Candidatus Limnocylindria bacterium]|nr:30S ribosomal protein S17 [Candidatus Limnocylindria bacterium]